MFVGGGGAGSIASSTSTMFSSQFSDPFVKVYLLQNGKKVSKKKTTVKRGEQHPIFNEAMIFSVPATALPVSIYMFIRLVIL